MNTKELENKVIEKLKTVYDPEIPVDIYELGLIYSIDVINESHIKIQMTLTSPSCPEAETIPGTVELTVKEIPGIETVEVEVTFSPPWEKEMMSEEAKLELGFL